MLIPLQRCVRITNHYQSSMIFKFHFCLCFIIGTKIPITIHTHHNYFILLYYDIIIIIIIIVFKYYIFTLFYSIFFFGESFFFYHYFLNFILVIHNYLFNLALPLLFHMSFYLTLCCHTARNYQKLH